MRTKYFKSYKALAKKMIKKARNGEYVVSVFGYPDAVRLTEAILKRDGVEISAIEIEPYEYHFYDREYYISIGEDMKLAVEPAYRGNTYLMAEGDVTYVSSDAHAEILKYISDSYYETNIGAECNYDCADCEFAEDIID